VGLSQAEGDFHHDGFAEAAAPRMMRVSPLQISNETRSSAGSRLVELQRDVLKLENAAGRTGFVAGHQRLTKMRVTSAVTMKIQTLATTTA
jgi:hypothetical protein